MKKEEFTKQIKDKTYFDINSVAKKNNFDLSTLPYTMRVLLENVLRKSTDDILQENTHKILNWKNNLGEDIAFYPARILLQDYTGVPCVVDIASMRDAAKDLGLNPLEINPEIPVDLVIDHSVQVDQAGCPSAMAYNIKKEFNRNHERYELLKWAQQSFTNFRAIPPDTGIVHQINIEYLSPLIQEDKNKILYPDSVFGTDSHTTMVNSLGVLGWGVGGIEAEACMLGEPSIFSIPEVIGVKLVGEVPAGVVATDIALRVTALLRENNVVAKFVEYFGEGYQNLSVADRATISNMSPEYGATCGYFPIDEQTLDYLHLTNRDSEKISIIESYAKTNGLFYDANNSDSIEYSKVLELDLSTVSSALSGPKRPQDLVLLQDLSESFSKAVVSPLGNKGLGGSQEDLNKEFDFTINHPEVLKTGDVLIAAITSCTNTSNPEVLIGAGLLAKYAVEKGLTISDKVKTSFAPGSQAVTRYLEDAGLMSYLNKLGFNIVAYGCTTCIGNSGPLHPSVEQALIDSEIIAGAVLSGNRNFESRIHPLIKANYLASPMLVIAYALAGNLRVNLTKDPIGCNEAGKNIYLKDIWPSSEEINTLVKKYVTSDVYRQSYKEIFSGTKEWNDLEVSKSTNFNWNAESTYIANPPYFDEQISNNIVSPSLKNMRVLASLGDSVTTDHISPAGTISLDSPAGKYLKEHKISYKDFNSYGSRRGNHHVMTRGTLANTRLNNFIAQGKIGGFTKYFPNGDIQSIYDASQKYKEDNVELVILAGKDYGMGSSRDWAAKGVKLLGVKVVIAESFERIHRSNLVMMGLVPLQYMNGDTTDSLGLTGEEIFDIDLPKDFSPKQIIKVKALKPDNSVVEFNTTLRYDTDAELSYYQFGGILNKVLNDKVNEK